VEGVMSESKTSENPVSPRGGIAVKQGQNRYPGRLLRY
jgi:hypothetical protein